MAAAAPSRLSVILVFREAVHSFQAVVSFAAGVIAFWKGAGLAALPAMDWSRGVIRGPWA